MADVTGLNRAFSFSPHSITSLRSSLDSWHCEVFKGGKSVSSLTVHCDNSKLNAIVVGGGVGGLHIATSLANQGLLVKLLEKNTRLGGRTETTCSDDGRFRFDLGPSLLLMPEKYQNAFEQLGQKLDSHVSLKRVDPAAYRVFFEEDKSELQARTHLDLFYDVQKMCSQLEAVEKGSGANYLRFLAFAKEALDKGTSSFIERDFKSIWDYIDLPSLLPLLRHLSPFDLLRDQWGLMGSFFKDPRLRALFTFQALYVGLSPFTAPGAFALLAATEIVDGVWYPMGGFSTVTDSLVKIAERSGVDLRVDSAVERVVIHGGKVVGVQLTSGEMLEADIVVSNVDLPSTYSELLPDKFAAKAKQLSELEYSSSVISFSWGINRVLEPLLHHNIFMSDEFEASWSPVFSSSSFVDAPNFYVHAPQRTDREAAPAGCDAITVLFPVANLKQLKGKNKLEYTQDMIQFAKSKILERFKRHGMGEVGDNIEYELVRVPEEWEQLYNLKNGSVFGLAHGLDQLAYLRPDVKEPNVKGLYFVGASTRPGNGVPLVLMGAKTTFERIMGDLSDVYVE